MTLELTLRVAARFRRLTDEEFEAMVRMIEDGVEPSDPATLARICDAIADAADEVRAEGQRPLRFKSDQTLAIRTLDEQPSPDTR